MLWVGSHVHTRVAGSGFHLPSASHTALVNPSGTNPGSHPKNITAPSVLFMKPFIGTVGSLQLLAGGNATIITTEEPAVTASALITKLRQLNNHQASLSVSHVRVVLDASVGYPQPLGTCCQNSFSVLSK